MTWRHAHIRLRRLESEAISIMREVVSDFSNPVMLYSIGKDSGAMLHIAKKAFHPSKPPFPLLHVDTTWKFRDMIAFRDEIARSSGMDLLIHINEEGLARGISPMASGSGGGTGSITPPSTSHPLRTGCRTGTTRPRSPSFSIPRVLYVSTVLTDTQSRAAIAVFESPQAIRLSTCTGGSP